VENTGQMEEAARKLIEMGPKAVIVTGGHLRDEALDIFHDGKVTIRLMGRKLAGNFHGTGCVFSAAIAAYLARDKTLKQAGRGAKAFIEKKVAAAFHPGGGMGVLI
ncbi:MAG: bifunctional hydroxymethylpyrimidine kinase/phosphomethylpyrimidine kinase, partial [Nitrospiraceae bacterium]|nr:bifunctional hydroxymethylpyrimidine kinase/phosphomethylpyrimidine kinase [Nitrospiraceae bacterium]